MTSQLQVVENAGAANWKSLSNLSHWQLSCMPWLGFERGSCERQEEVSGNALDHLAIKASPSRVWIKLDAIGLGLVDGFPRIFTTGYSQCLAKNGTESDGKQKRLNIITHPAVGRREERKREPSSF